jgi:hypothetical protein
MSEQTISKREVAELEGVAEAAKRAMNRSEAEWHKSMRAYAAAKKAMRGPWGTRRALEEASFAEVKAKKAFVEAKAEYERAQSVANGARSAYEAQPKASGSAGKPFSSSDKTRGVGRYATSRR